MWQVLKKSVSQGLCECEPPPRIVYQHLPDHVEHVLNLIPPVLLQILRDVVEQGLAVLPHVLAVRARRVPVEPTSLEEPTSSLLRHPRGDVAEDPLHHSQMLSILVGLEKSTAEGEFINDASY